MAAMVFYRFKSGRTYDSVPMDGPFISVGNLKDIIYERKQMGTGTDEDLVVTNAKTNEEYLDEATLIPKHTSVVVRRIPVLRCMPIVIQPKPKAEDNVEIAEPEKISLPAADSCVSIYPGEKELEDLWGPKVPEPARPMSKEEEDRKIKALVDTQVLDWQSKETHRFCHGFSKGMGGRTRAERGSGKTRLERIRPQQGYVCHRCMQPGHFIYHCPTNGDPNYDIKMVKRPTGIPKSMLVASGDVAVLKPDKDPFDKEMEGILSKRCIVDLPPGLHCPLCKEAMIDAVLASKCCFKSSCYKCISDHIITKSACICGATNILVDDLVPNKSVRDAINQILESGHCQQSLSKSAASKGEQKPSSVNDETPKIKETVDEAKPVVAPEKVEEKMMSLRQYEFVGHLSSPDHHKRKSEHQHRQDHDRRRRIESSMGEKASLLIRV